MPTDGSKGSARDLAGPSPYPSAVERVIAALGSLPGIGRRSAERLTFHLLKSDPEVALGLSRAVADLKNTVRHCPVCYNLADSGDVCGVCADTKRERGRVLVVEQPRDLIALEQTGMYRGLYHVLMGRLDPLDGVGPGELTIDRLVARLDDPGANAGGVRVEEVILGLNPTLEGDGTALYLNAQIKSRGVRVTRLARGLPTGGQLEFANRAVLADAIQGRQSME